MKIEKEWKDWIGTKVIDKKLTLNGLICYLQMNTKVMIVDSFYVTEHDIKYFIKNIDTMEAYLSNALNCALAEQAEIYKLDSHIKVDDDFIGKINSDVNFFNAAIQIVDDVKKQAI